MNKGKDHMREFEINCASRLNRQGGHEHITHLGHIANHWRLSLESMVRRIESGTEGYYLLDRKTGERLRLAVVREPGHTPYLRTQRADGWTDHLLALPECGRSCALIG
jgi:hypothetical protein